MSSIIKASSVSLNNIEVFDYKNHVKDAPTEYYSDEVDVIDVQTIEDDDILYDKELDEVIRVRIQEILDNARQESETIKKEANETGYQEGYNEGLKDAAEYKENIVFEYECKLKLEIQKLEKDNIIYIKSLENKILEMVMKISKNVVSQSLELDRKLILDVIKIGIAKINDVEQLNIKVCKKDFDTIIENKTDIEKYFSTDVKLSFMIDETMKMGDCIIETPYGIIDCGVHTKSKSILDNIREVANIDAI
ncbi:MAG TPA: hypothetical protein DEP72_05560 [Clostridiales bacterium]|nr:MAG: hypothetical protein A2Y18_02650 [Clostridiales bacterium GWD2_32_19]HCC07609.1 hypothetical protein [Clostridiales bacterium]